MKIARVFPRRTKATPDDPLAFTDAPDMFAPEVDEVHVSVAFTWDLPRAEWLARQWAHVAPVRIGGPATGERGEEFMPGMYLKRGYTITSRGCPNHCWFCSVWRREGPVRELMIRDGWNVLDDNLLACSTKHFKAVCMMLHEQKALGHRIEFTGGLEAARLWPWHVECLQALKPKQMFFAYDTPDDWEPLVYAAGLLREAGFTRNHLRCYVLIGTPRDTMESAEKRLMDVLGLGMFPMAMLWRNERGERKREWMRFQKLWARPALISSRTR